MGILKIVLLVIVVIIAIPLIIALFVKKQYSITRETTINKPVVDVYNYVRLLKNQDYYNKWVMQDPTMKKSFTGTDGTKGFVYAWNGNSKAGEGEQEIIALEENRKVVSELRFKRPMESTGISTINTEAASPMQTKVVIAMEGKNSYPLNFMNLFMDNMLGKDMDTTLSRLKTNMENSH